MNNPVLDVCCGSRMMWFDHNNTNAVFMDIRSESHILCDGRTLNINPSVVGDFRNIPFPDESFYLVVFDPPHLITLGKDSWMAKKYGRLLPDWRDDIRQGFEECVRVLKVNGTLIFKWNSTDIPHDEVLSLCPIKPLFGHTSGKQSKTIWCAFMKLCDERHA